MDRLMRYVELPFQSLDGYWNFMIYLYSTHCPRDFREYENI